MHRFQKWTRRLTMFVSKSQSISVPCLVEVIRLIGMTSKVGHLVALKMSLSFLPSLARLYWRVRKMWGMNLDIWAGQTPCFWLSLHFNILLIEGLMPAIQYQRKICFEPQCWSGHAPHDHDMAEVQDEAGVNIWTNLHDDGCNITVTFCVVSP